MSPSMCGARGSNIPRFVPPEVPYASKAWSIAKVG
jgi:hypothetical protein